MKHYKFLLFAFVLLLALISYVSCRGWQVLTLIHSTVGRKSYLIVCILLTICLFFGMFFEDKLSISLARPLLFLGYSFLLLVTYLFFSFLLVDIFRGLNHFLHFISDQGMIALRFWTMMASLVLIMVLMIAGNIKFNHPALVNLYLKSNKSVQNKEIKIVAVSDLHLGTCIDKKQLQKYITLINAQHPDLVLMVGDICDRSLPAMVHQNLKEDLQKIQAPLGVYAVDGNHEYYSFHLAEVNEYYKNAGVNVLRDSTVEIQHQFYLVGRDDYTNRQRKKLSELMDSFDPSKPVIVVDHQPMNLEESQEENIDLHLSGHTHNGQVFPGNLLAKRFFEVSYGYKKKRNTHIYVSSGLGLWGPSYRIGTQSELVAIHFQY
ncbi:MAG TPA: metallophosphoesterase [Paludibacteraceae bacterium]|nr:metallophosphoesterase [Paludibacteraceae bacterium]HOL00711.1 metallophosphoesterase [Paludibacteraceae bacterium]HPO67062.1 metallophosphoesterase [Paludibacteraceae bacterium]HRR62510.1 metallophosphoesterase [Paludibacteraceae bacterium]HRU64067.1 metallophosphoesterase [Paludibacteraceae bacterium]